MITLAAVACDISTCNATRTVVATPALLSP